MFSTKKKREVFLKYLSASLSGGKRVIDALRTCAKILGCLFLAKADFWLVISMSEPQSSADLERPSPFVILAAFCVFYWFSQLHVSSLGLICGVH